MLFSNAFQKKLFNLYSNLTDVFHPMVQSAIISIARVMVWRWNHKTSHVFGQVIKCPGWLPFHQSTANSSNPNSNRIIYFLLPGEDDSSWRCPQGLPDTTAVYTYNDQCFQFVDNEVYWTGARAYCMRVNTVKYQFVCCLYRWLSAKLQYLQCVSNGDTAVLH